MPSVKYRLAESLVLFGFSICLGCTSVNNDAPRYSSLTASMPERWVQPAVQPVSFEEEKPKRDLTKTITQSFRNRVNQTTGRGPNSQAALDQYRQADMAFRRASEIDPGNVDQRRTAFLEAGKLFAAAAKRWPDSQLEEDALFFAGEGFFFADRYPQANEFYEKLIKQYPGTDRLNTIEARRFRLAEFWLDQFFEDPQKFYEVNVTNKALPMRDPFGAAIKVLDQIRFDDPTGKLADDAIMAAGMAHFRRGNFLMADSFFTDLRVTFPSSDHQFAAHLFAIKSKLNAYKGPDYAGQALDEAEELIEQVARQFPIESRDERDYLESAYGETRYRKAEREWYMARFFERSGQNEAARFHYNNILTNYDDVERLTQMARNRLGDIAQRPAKPAQQLDWLVKLFPDSDTSKPLIPNNPATQLR